MKKHLTGKFWYALVIFSLMGQVAWVVENMYLNIFIYKMFHASASDISLMVGASSVAATATTILVGAFTDYVGRRKIFICGGYIAWGISILAFSLIRVDVLTPLAGSALQASSLGVLLVILLDCVMTFLGSSANDACFNAWMTDWGDGNNRGKIEGINSMMPLTAILVVFGGFSAFDLDQADSWSAIYLIVGAAVLLIGISGIFLIEEKGTTVPEEKRSYWKNLGYSFRLSVIKENPLLYAVIGAFAVFGISINIFMPYLILYYEKTLGMDNYVMIMAPAIVLAAVVTAFYGRLYDLLGFKSSVVPALLLLMAGYILLYFKTAVAPVFIGSLLMMTGYLTGMAVFGAMIRQSIPENKAGQFQGIRIIGQVLIPGIAGPAIGAAVLHDARQIVNSDGTTSFLPNRNIYLAALAAAALLLAFLCFLFGVMRRSHHTLRSSSGEALPDTPWSRYPRPQMRRENFFGLNGNWQIGGRNILVPFPPQSLLSGYQGHVGSRLEYSRVFTPPAEYFPVPESPSRQDAQRILLHFGAVDQIAEIALNGSFVGKHEGGYLPFCFDVTDLLVQGENRLTVRVTDTLSARYPYGKQRKARGGMWYTPVSGIWQSVWLECVPQTYIEKLELSADTEKVRITAIPGGTADAGQTFPVTATVTLHDGSAYTAQSGGSTLEIDLSRITLADGSAYQPMLWTPENPFLYTVTVTMGRDTVSSYFGLRTISIQNTDGQPRVCLNGKPVFLHGVLDQGYFCDGIYLPACEEEYERDILRMKDLGFNMLRKHIKIEPEWFYYYCDLHGMLVMQDMVNSGSYSWIMDTALPTLGFYRGKGGRLLGSRKRKDFFIRHMTDTIRHLQNHPCVISYTIFNEGWGQFEGDAMYELAKSLDGTRLYDTASGWFPGDRSDFDSQHIYFHPLKTPSRSNAPVLISECGGYSLCVPGHLYSKYTRFGYGDCADGGELTGRIREFYEKTVLPAVAQGVCGCVYTQLSDVEEETNGLYTYDRKVCKANPETLRAIGKKLTQNLEQEDRDADRHM